MTDFTRKPLFIQGARATYWQGTRNASAIPITAILTEDSIPILTELGEFLLTES